MNHYNSNADMPGYSLQFFFENMMAVRIGSTTITINKYIAYIRIVMYTIVFLLLYRMVLNSFIVKILKSKQENKYPYSNDHQINFGKDT